MPYWTGRNVGYARYRKNCHRERRNGIRGAKAKQKKKGKNVERRREKKENRIFVVGIARVTSFHLEIREMPGVASVRTDALARTLAATAPREEKPRICRYELAVPVLFSHLRNADAASERHWRRSKSSLRPAACLYTRARHLRATCVLFSWRLPSNPKRASIPSFEKEPGEPF